MKTSRVGQALSSVGLIVGIFYGMKHDKKIGVVALYGLGLGVVGMFVGNSISKFYED